MNQAQTYSQPSPQWNAMIAQTMGVPHALPTHRAETIYLGPFAGEDKPSSMDVLISMENAGK